MIQEFVCTTSCVHGKLYRTGAIFVGEEKDLPHDVDGKLVHWKPIEKGLVESAVSAEMEAMKHQIAELQAQISIRSEPKQQVEAKEVQAEIKEKPAGENREILLPTNGQIKARLDELEIPWKAPMNKTQLLALLPEGTTFTLADGSVWMKE